MSPRIIAAFVVATLALALPSVTRSEPTADAAPKRASLQVSPAVHVAGQSLTWKGRLPVRGKRRIVLQQHMGRPGDQWFAVPGFRARTKKNGSFSFRFPAPGMFNIKMRVRSGKYVTPARRFSAKGQEITAWVTGQPNLADAVTTRVPAGRPFGITVDTTPTLSRRPDVIGTPALPGRRLTLQRRITGDSWRTIATGATDARGLGQFSGLVEPDGVAVYRVRQEDWTAQGSHVGWQASFPLHLEVGSGRLGLTQPSWRDIGTPRNDGPAGATPSNAGKYTWGASLWDFAWERGESLGSRPSRGTARRGSWLDYVDGSGRVSRHNGQLVLDSKRHDDAGPGDFGTTRATLRGNARSYGRWETRVRLKSDERGARPYDVLVELVPEDPARYECGTHNITVARLTAGVDQVRFGVRTPTKQWQGSTGASIGKGTVPVVGVEVSAKHVSWFVNGRVAGTVRGRSAVSGLPMTMRLSLVGAGTTEMDHTTVLSDWQRGFSLDRGKLSKRGPALAASAAPAC